MTTHVLAVANQKGGVAKTTTVASLGAAMVDAGRRVLLVDLDPQGCLTFSLGQDSDNLAVSVHEVLLGEVEPNAALVDTAEGMTLLPANIDLAGAEAMLLMRAGREYALKRALDKLGDTFDVVIIDCPPSLGVLTINGLTAADSVLIPLQCEALSHRGVGRCRRGHCAVAMRDAGSSRRRAVPAYGRRRSADHQSAPAVTGRTANAV